MQRLQFIRTWVVIVFWLASALANAEFTTVINVPPDIAPSSIGSNTQLNLGIGGYLDYYFKAGNRESLNTDIEVNINGGTTGYGFSSNDGSIVNLYAGLIGRSSRMFGGVTNIYGGMVDDGFKMYSGELNFFGGSFSDGMSVDGDSVVNILGG